MNILVLDDETLGLMKVSLKVAAQKAFENYQNSRELALGEAASQSMQLSQQFHLVASRLESGHFNRQPATTEAPDA